MTVIRRRRQNSTKRSIIEQDSAAYDHLLAGLETGANRDLRAFVQERLDRTALDDAGAGGVVAPVTQTAAQTPPQAPPPAVAQASYLDSR